MKTKGDPRHQARVAIVKKLFANSFEKQETSDEQTRLILEKKASIDKLIEENAKSWPIPQIAPIDLAILRLAIFELIFKDKKEPYKVIVDEAVEIAKEFGNEASASFINGVMGSIIKNNIRKAKKS